MRVNRAVRGNSVPQVIILSAFLLATLGTPITFAQSPLPPVPLKDTIDTGMAVADFATDPVFDMLTPEGEEALPCLSRSFFGASATATNGPGSRMPRLDGPIVIRGDADLDGLNGYRNDVCLSTRPDFTHEMSRLAFLASSMWDSVNLRGDPPRGLISIEGTTRRLLLYDLGLDQGAPFTAPQANVALHLRNVTNVFLDTLNAPGADIVIEDSHLVQFLGPVTARTITIVDSPGPIILEDLTLTGIPNDARPLIDIRNSQPEISQVQVWPRVQLNGGDSTGVGLAVTGPRTDVQVLGITVNDIDATPCISVAGGASLTMRSGRVDLTGCSGQLLGASDATQITLDALDLLGTLPAGIAFDIAARQSITVTGGSFEGGDTPFRLSGAAGQRPTWYIGPNLASNGSAPLFSGARAASVLVDATLGDGRIYRTHFLSADESSAPFLQADGSSPAPAAASTITIANNEIGAGEFAAPAGLGFNDFFQTVLNDPPSDGACWQRIRLDSGRCGGNDWAGYGAAGGYDGDYDGLGDVAYQPEGVDEVDEAPLTLPNYKPILYAYYNPDPSDPFAVIQPGTLIQLSGDAIDPDGDPVTTLWEFGDDATSPDAVTDHAYAAPGIYQLVFSARDEKGAVARVQVPVYVDRANAPPNITVPPRLGRAPDCAPIGASYLYQGQTLCMRAAATDKSGHDRLDVLYLDVDGDGTISVGDLRLSRALGQVGLPAGVVGPTDSDLSAPLTFTSDVPTGSELPSLSFATLASDGEGVYLDADGDGSASLGDLRLSHPRLPAGLRLRPVDEDFGLSLAPINGTFGADADPLSSAIFLDIPAALLDPPLIVTIGDLEFSSDRFGVPVNETTPQLATPIVELPSRFGVWNRDAWIHYSWTLGDGKFLSGPEILKSYTAPKGYRVKVEAFDAGQPIQIASALLNVSIRSSDPPTVDFTVDDVGCGAAGCVLDGRRAVVFNDTTDPSSDQSPIVYSRWDFGDQPDDSDVLEGFTVEYTFVEPGTYTITHTVRTDDGLTGTIARVYRVTSQTPFPIIDYTPQLNPTVEDKFRFSAEGALDMGESIGATDRPIRWADLDDDGNVGPGDLAALDLDNSGSYTPGDFRFAPLETALVGDPLIGTKFAPRRADQRTAFCWTDAEAPGEVGFGVFSIDDSLFLSLPGCVSTAQGDIRFQRIGNLAAGSFVYEDDPDISELLPLNGYALALDLDDHVYLDADSTGDLTAGDVRLSSVDRRFPASRVLPESAGGDDNIVAYEWTCTSGCEIIDPATGRPKPSGEPLFLSDDGTFSLGKGYSARFYTAFDKCIELRVIDEHGDDSSKFFCLSLDNIAPVAKITYQPKGIPKNLALFPTDLDVIEFNSTTSRDPDGSLIPPRWEFSDGDTATTSIYTKKFTEPGTYTVTLTVFDDQPGLKKKSHTITQTIFVSNLPPVADFVSAPQAPLTLLPVQFDGGPSQDLDGSVTRWEWMFGDTLADSGENVASGRIATHSYSKTGEYKVTLRVYDDHPSAPGDLATNYTEIEKKVFIHNRPPVVRAQVDQPVQLPPANLTFSAQGSSDLDGSIKNFTWDFKDGTPPFKGDDKASKINHTFKQRGIFEVTVTARDDSNDTATATVLVTILNQPPRITLVPPKEAQANHSVAFQALSLDPEKDDVTYRIDWGDKTNTTTGPTNKNAMTFNHTYKVWGNFRVVASVIDAGGASSNTTHTLRVLSQRPTASLKTSLEKVLLGEEVTVIGSSSDADGQVAGHFIDMGDGTTAFASTYSHRYKKPGVYTVLYRVTDNSQATSTSTLEVDVRNPPPLISGLSVTPDDPVVGDILLFSAEVTDDDATRLQYAWNFQDGVVSTLKTPTHVYRSPGLYHIELSATDQFGGKTSKILQLRVKAPDGLPQAPAGGDELAGIIQEAPQREDAPAPAVLFVLFGLLLAARLRRRAG